MRTGEIVMKPATFLFSVGLLLTAEWAAAQPVYRSIDSRGNVSFSDQPPPTSGCAAEQVTTPIAGALGPASASSSANASSAAASLPYELRRIADRYPVTLYTGTDCAPCIAGRSLLVTRGIPFSERTVMTREDSETLLDLTGQKSLPVLHIGTQLLKGFSDAEWSRYLDAAGYPTVTMLPAHYRNPPTSPLVALQAAPVPGSKNDLPRSPTPQSAPGTAPGSSNPAGIRF